MDGWWEEIEREFTECLAACGEAAPAEIGKRLGLSEERVASLIAVLAIDRAVRITRVASGSRAPLPAPSGALTAAARGGR